jgi:anti-sigma-K factor RskA
MRKESIITQQVLGILSADDRNSNALTIAQDMALGLAAGHWTARANMLDVEYVIGSRRPTSLAARILALDAEEKLH